MFGNRKCIRLAIFILLALFGIQITAQSAADPSADQMTLWRARRVLTLNTDFKTTGQHLRIEGSSLRITAESIEFDIADLKKATRQPVSIDLRTLGDTPIECKYHAKIFFCILSDGARWPKDDHSPLGLLFYTGPLNPDCCCVSPDCAAVATKGGEFFVSAINRLRAFAKDTGSPLRDFTRTAAAWRALATKPPLAEDARLQRLLAEDAIENKAPAFALYYYEHGLEIDPTWAQGYYNAALVAGELNLYEQAAEHMQSYLELMPDAPDAQSARDQISIWKFKAQQK